MVRPLPAADKKAFAVNMLDLDTVTQDAMTARSWGADVVVALLDYGTEYEQEPSADQKELSEEILDHGRGRHPWLPCPRGPAHRAIFTYASWRVNDKYVAYSLGDFVSASRTDRRAGHLQPTSPTAG